MGNYLVDILTLIHYSRGVNFSSSTVLFYVVHLFDCLLHCYHRTCYMKTGALGCKHLHTDKLNNSKATGLYHISQIKSSWIVKSYYIKYLTSKSQVFTNVNFLRQKKIRICIFFRNYIFSLVGVNLSIFTFKNVNVYPYYFEWWMIKPWLSLKTSHKLRIRTIK